MSVGVRWLAVALLLLTSAGCARKDWVTELLVLTDVTGTWKGWVTLIAEGDPTVRPRAPITLVLEQNGPKVTGWFSPSAGTVVQVEGTVAGEVLTVATHTISGEFAIEGDEMAGIVQRAEIPGSVGLVKCPCRLELHRERPPAPAAPSR